MDSVKFSKSGGPISVEVVSKNNKAGSYTFLLWEANVNLVVFKRKGNFINDADDKYELPLPVEMNNGRIIDFIVTLITPPSFKNYDIEIIVTQDEKTIGFLRDSGTSLTSTVTVEIMVVLEGV
jgi:hypothetical protein